MVFLEMFWTFFRIGLFTFGGGYAMIPMITDETVSRGWITLETVADFVAVSESTPGPFAVNIATFVGYRVGSSIGGWGLGCLGALCTTLGVILPSFLVILLVSKFFWKYRQNRYVDGALTGIRPSVIGLIASAGAGILLKNIYQADTWCLSESGLVSLLFTLCVFGLSMIKIKGKKIGQIYLILLSATAGILIYGVLLY